MPNKFVFLLVAATLFQLLKKMKDQIQMKSRHTYTCKVRDHKIFKELASGNGYRIKANLKCRAKRLRAGKAKDLLSFTMLVKYSRWIVSVDP